MLIEKDFSSVIVNISSNSHLNLPLMSMDRTLNFLHQKVLNPLISLLDTITHIAKFAFQRLSNLNFRGVANYYKNNLSAPIQQSLLFLRDISGACTSNLIKYSDLAIKYYYYALPVALVFPIFHASLLCVKMLHTSGDYLTNRQDYHNFKINPSFSTLTFSSCMLAAADVGALSLTFFTAYTLLAPSLSTLTLGAVTLFAWNHGQFTPQETRTLVTSSAIICQ